jgi:hypothetical protein
MYGHLFGPSIEIRTIGNKPNTTLNYKSGTAQPREETQHTTTHMDTKMGMATKFLYIFVIIFNVTVLRSSARIPVPALIVFGDSITDPGNNNGLISWAKSNFPPYGRDFKDHIATGRFSNGKIPPDFLGEAKPILVIF